MTKDIKIRLEERKDWREVEELTRAAFWREDRIKNIGVGATEHYMVHMMRGRDGIDELTFVAEVDGEIVGHLIYCKGSYVLQPDGTRKEVLNFGPLSVLPKYQKQGIGSALMKYSIKCAKEQGYGAILFYGHPTYYPRFGFKEAKEFGITTQEGENFSAFMAMELREDYLSGVTGKYIEAPIYDERLTKKPAKEYDKFFFNNSKFINTIKYSNSILTEGAIVERLKSEYNLILDDDVMHAGFIYDANKKEILKSIYKQYIDIAMEYDLPIILTTPTRRANIERVKRSCYSDKDVNGDCIRFMKSIREKYPNKDQDNIFIGGLMGCKNDAYKADQALSIQEAYEFHRYQVHKFSESKIDFVLAAVLPAKSEAIGIAKLLSEYDIPYILSFVIRDSGILLDGTTLNDAIKEIDSLVSKKPTYYMVNCVHTDVLIKALSQSFNQTEIVRNRLIGIQANASRQTPEELEGGKEVILDTVDNIVAQLIELHNDYHLRVLGGCCGTNDKHISQLAKRLRSK